ncbi:unnamed protein product, partial [Ectocarpus sp. 8 AP-2014]
RGSVSSLSSSPTPRVTGCAMTSVGFTQPPTPPTPPRGAEATATGGDPARAPRSSTNDTRLSPPPPLAVLVSVEADGARASSSRRWPFLKPIASRSGSVAA